MNVLFYATGEAGDRLQRVIQSLVPTEKLEVFGTVESFSERLRRPSDDIPVAVILAASEEHLLNILSISHLLYDVRFILILPDRDDQTVAIGHSLRPRFLSYADTDFREVTAVLGKMIGGFYYTTRKAKDQSNGRASYPVARSLSGHQLHYKKFA